MPNVPSPPSQICPVCAAPDSPRRPLTNYPQGGPQYTRCPACGLVSLHPLAARPTNEAFEDEAEARRMDETDARRTAYFARRLDWIESLTGPQKGGRMLEIGCGPGRLLALARRRGWKAEAVELSGALAALARANNPAAPIHQLDFLNWPAAAAGSGQPAFDAIIALDVIEHLPDPRRMLRQARAMLRPGGALLVQTPNSASLRARLAGGGWNMLIPEYHLHLFNRKNLVRLLSEEGFEIVRAMTVSGSGCERGVARLKTLVQERLLSFFGLGNALLILARARATSERE